MDNKGIQTVLVIDDSKAVRDISKDILNLLDVHVLTAENGEEGIAVYQQNDIDLVLLDMNMPQMDGAETYKQLLDINADVKVIICSSNSQSKVESRLEKIVVAPLYLHKPFDTQIFLNTVESTLST
jgi:CheY-like chemotaxis protein